MWPARAVTCHAQAAKEQEDTAEPEILAEARAGLNVGRCGFMRPSKNNAVTTALSHQHVPYICGLCIGAATLRLQHLAPRRAMEQSSQYHRRPGMTCVDASVYMGG